MCRPFQCWDLPSARCPCAPQTPGWRGHCPILGGRCRAQRIAPADGREWGCEAKSHAVVGTAHLECRPAGSWQPGTPSTLRPFPDHHDPPWHNTPLHTPPDLHSGPVQHLLQAVLSVGAEKYGVPAVHVHSLKHHKTLNCGKSSAYKLQPKAWLHWLLPWVPQAVQRDSWL